MRRLAALLSIGLAISATTCKRKARHGAPAELLSVLKMDDPRAGAQLVRGVYALEEDRWRWTGSRFTVILMPPPGAAQSGARLELMLNIPDVVVKELGSMTLSALAGEIPLAPETYTRAGEYTYARDVPASALNGDSVSIEFATDRAIPARKIDQRELALVVTSIALITKPTN